MSKSDDAAQRRYRAALLDKLVRAGWLESWMFHAGQNHYGVVWSAAGLERRRWLLTIERELQPSAEQLGELLLLCVVLQPPARGQ